jgi:hypothetical protein
LKGNGVRDLLELVILGVSDGVAQIDQELRQAALGGGVVTEHVGKGRISEGLGQTLSESLPGAIVVTESAQLSVSIRAPT